MGNERLTWKQIKEKYPDQDVGLYDIETEENSKCVKSAIVKYTSNDTSYEDLCLRSILGEIMMVHTSMDKKDLIYVPNIVMPTQFGFGCNYMGEDTENERTRGIQVNSDSGRLTWEQIKEKYPYQYVGLADMEREESYDSVISAIVKYTGKDTSFEELLKRQAANEILLMYTGRDEEEVEGILCRCRQGEDNEKEKEGINKNRERLTWVQIQEKYPLQNVGLVDVEYKSDSVSVRSAIVKYTSKDTSYEELCMRHMAGEILMRYTTPDIIEMGGKYYKAVLTDAQSIEE